MKFFLRETESWSALNKSKLHKTEKVSVIIERSDNRYNSDLVCVVLDFLWRLFDNNFFGENYFDEPVFDEFFDENILDNNFWTNTFSLQKTFLNHFLTIKNFDDKFLDCNFVTTTLLRTFLKRTSDKKIIEGKSKK